MSNGLEGKIALVTGGSSGIGRATAIAFSRAGAKVTIADIDARGGQETVTLVQDQGGEATFFECDVSKSDHVNAVVHKCVQLYGRLDCAYNNAAVLGRMDVTVNCTEENFDRIMQMNLKSVWLCMKYEIVQMLKQDAGGTIVNAGSNAGLRGVPELPAYAASKAAVHSLTRTAALEYAKSNIRVNAVCPGLIWTPMVQRQTEANPGAVEKFKTEAPTGRLGTPEEIAEAVVWLSSSKASFVTGSIMPVDGALVA